MSIVIGILHSISHGGKYLGPISILVLEYTKLIIKVVVVGNKGLQILQTFVVGSSS